METEIVFVLLFAIATAVAMVARALKMPYTVALVLAGLAIGAFGTFEGPHLTKELLYAVFLPGLLFEAAFHLEFQRFWSNKVSVTALAVPGLIVAIVLTSAILTPAAGALHFVEGFDFVHGLVFASLIAATDPIAVVGLFKRLGAPKRLAVLVEGESLINDGTAVVVFTLVLTLVGGGNLTFSQGLVQFLWVAGAGALVGLAFGFSVSWLTHRIEDAMVEITLTTIAAYGSFSIAEHFHVSGVIATVVAGMLCGNYGARTGMSASTKLAVLSFWEYWAFALNSIVFLLVGLEVEPQILLHAWMPVLVAFGAVLVARAAVVYIVTGLLSRTRERFPWSFAAVLTWGGLRGSLSMVLVLGLAADFPHRALLVNMTFGVVVLSILVQGLTVGPLLRRLGFTNAVQHVGYEVHRGNLFAARAALRELESMTAEGRASANVLDDLRRQYMQRVDVAEREITAMHLATDDLREEEQLRASRHLLLVEKQSLVDSQRTGVISHEVFETLLGRIDARLLRIEDGEPLPPFEGPEA